ncbi:hypothetical protein J6590_032634 [Homalodisca vitripennis]|nr:hypothetical protein J6590_032634 [Homalodisca vitripennis]
MIPSLFQVFLHEKWVRREDSISRATLFALPSSLSPSLPTQIMVLRDEKWVRREDSVSRATLIALSPPPQLPIVSGFRFLRIADTVIIAPGTGTACEVRSH